MNALLLAVLLEAAVVRGPFAPQPGAWGRALGSAVGASAPRSPTLAGLSALDPLKPGHAPSFEPLTRALAALGQTPQAFAALPEPERAELIVRAAAAAEKDVRSRAGEPELLARHVVTHRMYLDASTAARVDGLYAKALERDAEGKLARARAAAERWLSSGELEAGDPAVVLAFDPYRARKARAEPKRLDRHNPGLDLALRMRGVDAKGPLPKPDVDPLLDPFEKAQNAAWDLARPEGKVPFFAEAWAPSGKENTGKWRFVFYALREAKSRMGHRIDVAFVDGRPVASITRDVDVAPRHVPFPMTRYLLAKGTGWGVSDARRILADKLPDQDVGLTVSLRMRRSDDGDDLWLSFEGPAGELAAINGRTGQVAGEARSEPGWLDRLIAWWRAR